MARRTRKLIDRALGYRDPRAEGMRRALTGLRVGDSRELSMGLALLALAYLRQTEPKKQLIYRKAVPEGSALVIHHKRSGTPRLEIIKPKKR
jgi:hypothetical protein